MKGLLLAGGRGTRLRPITHTSAKQLVPVANVPILFYALQQLVDAGITDIGIVTGDSEAAIRGAVGDGSRWGAAITYIPQGRALGIAHAVAVARPFLGDDDFVLYLGDNLLEQGVRDLVERFEAARATADDHRPAAHVLLATVEEPQRFGVAELDGGRIVRLVEKPAEPPSDLAMVGVYLFGSDVHEVIAGLEPSARGEIEIVDAVQGLIDRGQPVHHDVLTGWWLDTGKKDSLLEANRRVLGVIAARVDGSVDAASDLIGSVVVEAGATIERSTIRGPVVIGAGTTITDSTIGPFTSIGPASTVRSSTISDSVLLEGVCVDGIAHLAESLIGRDTSVVATTPGATSLTLLLGDHCRIEVPAP